MNRPRSLLQPFVPSREAVWWSGWIVVPFLCVFSNGCAESRSRIISLDFSPDGRWLAVGQVESRDANTPGKLHEADVRRTVALISVDGSEPPVVVAREVRRGNQGPLKRTTPRVRFLPDNSTPVFSLWPNRPASSFDLPTRTLRPLPIGDLTGVSSIVPSHSGNLLAVETRSGLELFDRTTGTRRDFEPEHSGSPFRHSSIEFSADDRLLAVVDGFGRGGIFDVETGERIAHWPDRTGDVQMVRFSPRENVVGIAMFERILIARWDSREELKDLFASPRTKPVASLDRIDDLAFSPDGETLAACAGGLRLIPLANPESERTIPGTAGIAVTAWSPNGKLIATGDYKSTVELWDAASLERRATFRVRHRWRLSALVPFVALVLWILALRAWPVERNATVAVPHDVEAPRWPGHTYGALVAALVYAALTAAVEETLIRTESLHREFGFTASFQEWSLTGFGAASLVLATSGLAIHSLGLTPLPRWSLRVATSLAVATGVFFALR